MLIENFNQSVECSSDDDANSLTEICVKFIWFKSIFKLFLIKIIIVYFLINSYMFDYEHVQECNI